MAGGSLVPVVFTLNQRDAFARETIRDAQLALVGEDIRWMLKLITAYKVGQ